MEFPDPISFSLEIHELGPKGYEVILSIVNEGEDWLVVKHAEIEVIKDEKSFGRHPVLLYDADPYGMVRLGQFEIAHGHFHISPDLDHKLIDFKVAISYRYGDHDEMKKLSRRIETQRIKRKFLGI